MKLKLRPEEKAELLIVGLGLLASYAVQELTAHAIRWHVDAHEADAEATRLRAENDQLRKRHDMQTARLRELQGAQPPDDHLPPHAD